MRNRSRRPKILTGESARTMERVPGCYFGLIHPHHSPRIDEGAMEIMARIIRRYLGE
jgi:hypothetical protein